MPRQSKKKASDEDGESKKKGGWGAPGARPIWKGSISFGLVNVPVTLYSMEKKKELSFHMLDSRDKSRIRYERVNESTGKEVPWNQIVKGYEYSEGAYVLLTDQDFRNAAGDIGKTVEIIDFVDRKAITDIYIEKPYLTVPIMKSEKGYVLLRETLRKTGKAGIAKVAIRTRDYLAAVVPEGDALVVLILRYDSEVRHTETFELPSGKPEDFKITDRELALAEQLVASMEADWEPEKYVSTYQETLLEYIEARAEAGEMAAAPSVDEDDDEAVGNVVDLAGLLRKSMGGKAKSGDDEEDEEEKSSKSKKAKSS